LTVCTTENYQVNLSWCCWFIE